MGAEIDEAGHQHDARRDVGRAAHDAARHGAEAGLAESRRVPAGELGRHLVPPDRPAGPALDHRHVVEAEREQHRLLQPLVDGPAVGGLLGDAQLAAVEQVERGLDRVADLAPGVEADPLAVRERGLDHARQIVVLHDPAFRTSAPVSQRLGGCQQRALAAARPRLYRRRSIVTVTGPHRSCRSIRQPCPTASSTGAPTIVGPRAGAPRSRTTGHPTRSTSGATSMGWPQPSLRPRTTEEVAALVALAAGGRGRGRAAGRQHRAGRRRHSRPFRPAAGPEPGRPRPDPRGRSARRVAGGRGRLHAGGGAGGGRGRGPAVPAQPRQRGHLPDRRQPLQQRRRGQRHPLRHGARAGARASRWCWATAGSGTACARCARTIPATT